MQRLLAWIQDHVGCILVAAVLAGALLLVGTHPPFCREVRIETIQCSKNPINQV